VFSWPTWAHPRNLTGSDGRLKKDKRQTCKKAGVRWAGCPGGDTQQPPPPPASLLYIVTNKEVEQQILGWHDNVVIGNRGNLWLLLSAHTGTVPVWRAWCRHPCSYAKQLCCILPSPLLQLGVVLIPACRLFDMAVLMSTSHRLLIIHSPQGVFMHLNSL
jgi:hypothetical protein